MEIDPEKAGFVPGRLDRIDRQLARYVDGGLLTGSTRWSGSRPWS